MSWSLERSEETGANDDWEISLFDVVVNNRRLSRRGRRLVSCAVRSAMDVEAATGRDRVAGKPRPEKDVRRTLIFRLDIVLRLNWC